MSDRLLCSAVTHPAEISSLPVTDVLCRDAQALCKRDGPHPFRLCSRGYLQGINGQLVIRSLDELRPHPSYLRHQLKVSESSLAALAASGDLGFREPLLITRDGVIIDGYAQFALARLHGRTALSCLEFNVTEAEALDIFLQKSRRSSGLNDYLRILLALDLEPWFREKARSNQRAGGHGKGSSKLAEDEKLDVRREIAAAAGVSAGNVRKVKELASAHPEVLRALRDGEIRIHRAWRWSKEALAKQEELVRLHRTTRGIRLKIRTFVSRHQAAATPIIRDVELLHGADVADLLRRLSQLVCTSPGCITVAAVNSPGRAVIITAELLQALGTQRELPLV